MSSTTLTETSTTSTSTNVPVAELFLTAGTAFQKLGDITGTLSTNAVDHEENRWSEKEIDILKSAIIRFANDLDIVAESLLTRSKRMIRTDIKRRTLQMGTEITGGNAVNNTTRTMFKPITVAEAKPTATLISTPSNLHDPSTLQASSSNLLRMKPDPEVVDMARTVANQPVVLGESSFSDNKGIVAGKRLVDPQRNTPSTSAGQSIVWRRIAAPVSTRSAIRLYNPASLNDGPVPIRRPMVSTGGGLRVQPYRQMPGIAHRQAPTYADEVIIQTSRASIEADPFRAKRPGTQLQPVDDLPPKISREGDLPTI